RVQVDFGRCPLGLRRSDGDRVPPAWFLSRICLPTPPRPNESDDHPSMSGFKHPDFSERLSHAAAARKALLAKFKAAPSPDDPTIAAKRREREAIAAARAARAAERERQRQAREAELARQRER